VMALADIAKFAPAGVQADAVSLAVIAERQHLSAAYLEQLFVALRRAELVESVRGRSGGYRLARPAASITIAQIMTAVEEDTRMTRCHDEPGGCVGSELPDARLVARAGASYPGVPRRNHTAGRA
jgi:Rrf2 family protein